MLTQVCGTLLDLVQMCDLVLWMIQTVLYRVILSSALGERVRTMRKRVLTPFVWA